MGIKSQIRGLVRRKMYKKERAPGRMDDLAFAMAPMAVPDAMPEEIIRACVVIARQMGFKIGIGRDYDRIKDQYVVTGKSARTKKAQDFKIPGALVALTILTERNGIEWLLKHGRSPALDSVRARRAPAQAPATQEAPNG